MDYFIVTLLIEEHIYTINYLLANMCISSILVLCYSLQSTCLVPYPA